MILLFVFSRVFNDVPIPKNLRAIPARRIDFPSPSAAVESDRESVWYIRLRSTACFSALADTRQTLPGHLQRLPCGLRGMGIAQI